MAIYHLSSLVALKDLLFLPDPGQLSACTRPLSMLRVTFPSSSFRPAIVRFPKPSFLVTFPRNFICPFLMSSISFHSLQNLVRAHTFGQFYPEHPSAELHFCRFESNIFIRCHTGRCHVTVAVFSLLAAKLRPRQTLSFWNESMPSKHVF